ncbi:hypothetical protein H3V53_24200 [Paraburkholderia bengalensis]|uniref:Uncharacterized protein n=1 Tax=Paraburkholderia bengalensis TaxID=2747562 RepID=A0ABU8IXM8_9BURK
MIDADVIQQQQARTAAAIANQVCAAGRLSATVAACCHGTACLLRIGLGDAHALAVEQGIALRIGRRVVSRVSVLQCRRPAEQTLRVFLRALRRRLARRRAVCVVGRAWLPLALRAVVARCACIVVLRVRVRISATADASATDKSSARMRSRPRSGCACAARVRVQRGLLIVVFLWQTS